MGNARVRSGGVVPVPAVDVKIRAVNDSLKSFKDAGDSAMIGALGADRGM